MATREASKNALYFAFKCLYLKNELGDHQFVLLESDWQGMITLSEKFQKILSS